MRQSPIVLVTPDPRRGSHFHIFFTCRTRKKMKVTANNFELSSIETPISTIEANENVDQVTFELHYGRSKIKNVIISGGREILSCVSPVFASMFSMKNGMIESNPKNVIKLYYISSKAFVFIIDFNGTNEEYCTKIRSFSGLVDINQACYQWCLRYCLHNNDVVGVKHLMNVVFKKHFKYKLPICSRKSIHPFPDPYQIKSEIQDVVVSIPTLWGITPWAPVPAIQPRLPHPLVQPIYRLTGAELAIIWRRMITDSRYN